MEGQRPARTGVGAISEYLEGEGVAHEVIEHAETMSAAAEAQETHRPPRTVAKTVVLQDHAACVLAVVPASERVDLHKLRELLGASRSLQLATEEEIARRFPTFDVGALPPLGPMLPAAEVVDRRLVEEDRVLCAAGDHRHSIVVDPREVVRATGAAVADICED